MKRLPSLDKIKCPCGNVFDLDGLKMRGRGGKWLNKELEYNALDSEYFEAQCPKCLLWVDMQGEIRD